MKVDVDDGFAEKVTTLETQFTAATDALAKGDFGRLEAALKSIEQVAHVLLVVLGALKSARAKK